MIKELWEMFVFGLKSFFLGSYRCIKQDYNDFINWLFND